MAGRGSQNHLPTRTGPPLEGFFAFVRTAKAPDECWLWDGCLMTNGYGVTRQGGSLLTGKPEDRLRYAHRVMYEFAYGEPPPPNKVLRHTCDNPLCVRPSHLLPGTRAQNTADSVARGRCTTARRRQAEREGMTLPPGSPGNARQTRESAEAIRTAVKALRTAGVKPALATTTVAQLTGYSAIQIVNILQGYAWASPTAGSA